ncbi:MAG: glycine--tRNA ligase subunit beta [Myxococcota bacterium]
MNLLLEIGTEELPSSALQIALEFLPKQLQVELEASRLTATAIEAFGTPRRIILLAQNLDAKQADLDSEVLGPKVEIAFDASGNLTPAGGGFIKSRGLDPSAAYQKQTDKGTVLAAKLHEKGAPTADVLAKILPALIGKIPFAKTMRWDQTKTRFSRPIRWLLCLLDSQIVSFEIAGVQSSDKTCGHRLMNPGFETVTQDSYFAFLQNSHVVFDTEKRIALILAEAQRLAKSVGGELLPDPELLKTVANLVECPWPILGHFDGRYLEIPQEILISEMREHQKYFAILNPAGGLMPNFVVVSGSEPVNAERLAAGNARVLKARFEDGAFYYSEDLKKPLEAYVSAAPTELIAWAKKFDQSAEIERAALLCKADLNTGVVGEFPELQGIIGGIYATKSGEKAEVAQAIAQHYQPRFATDQLPSSWHGAVLSLADRLNTLHTRKLPKGSADPYGLRRAAIGLVRIILGYNLKVNLRELIAKEDILEFVMMRARGVFLEDHPVLVVDATQKAAAYDLCAWQARIQALEQFDYTAVSAVFKRVSNLVSKAVVEKTDTSFLKETSEIELAKAIQAVKLSDNHLETLAQLGNIKPILDQFFEDVMVMVDDIDLRNARLGLLTQVQQKASHIADFSKLSEKQT